MFNSFQNKLLSLKNKARYGLLGLFLSAFSLQASSQWTNIPITQVDARFTIRAERSWGFGEQYQFYVKNNTGDAYDLVIDVTLHLACVGTKTFTLGVNQVVELEPNGSFSPGSDYVHGYTPPTADNFKDCRLTDGNSFTLYQGLEYRIRKIINKTQEARAAEEKRKEEEAAAAKAAAVKEQQAKEAQQKLEEAAKQQKQAIQSQSATQNTTGNKADDDFWETGKSAPKGAAANNKPTIDRSQLPEFFRTTDGKYYHKVGDQITEVNQAQYQQLKQQNASQGQSQASQTVTLTPEEQQRTVDNIMSKIKAQQQQDQRETDEFNRKLDLQAQSFAATKEVSAAKNALYENSNLDGNYRSVDELMADFNRKMANVNQLVSNLTEKQNANMSAAADAAFSKPEEAGYAAGVKAIAGLINSASEARQRRLAQERLQEQKKQAMQELQEQEKQLITGVRQDLFKRFKEGGLPMSETKINANTLYYFAYAYDPQQVGIKQTTLYISNVFPISRYSDGTWPFKSNITSEINKLTPYNEVLHGYYTSKQEAESMRKGMINIFMKTGGYTKDISYKGKLNTGSISSGDFWESGKKQTNDSSSVVKPVKKDDFWNN